MANHTWIRLNGDEVPQTPIFVAWHHGLPPPPHAYEQQYRQEVWEAMYYKFGMGVRVRWVDAVGKRVHAHPYLADWHRALGELAPI